MNDPERRESVDPGAPDPPPSMGRSMSAAQAASDVTKDSQSHFAQAPPAKMSV